MRPPSGDLPPRPADPPPVRPAIGHAPPPPPSPVQPAATPANARPTLLDLPNLPQSAAIPPVLSHPAEEPPPVESGVLVARFAEPWMVSLFVHLVILLITGLWFIPRTLHNALNLEVIFAESLGEQMSDDTLQMAADEPPAPAPLLSESQLPEVADPIAAPLPVALPDSGDILSGFERLPEVGMALEGRTEGMRRALLKAFGGTALTEQAVTLGLEWLARQQSRNGLWSLTGPYSDGALSENQVAATAMALIAFQGAGHTHQVGSHKGVVARGVWALVRLQDSDGSFWPPQREKRPPTTHRLYTHALATIALSELYGMTQDPKLRSAAQKAIDYAVGVQADVGGWRYLPGEDSDTSVTGWFVMALQSGRMAGLEVPSPALMAVSDYLDTVAFQEGARYAYHPGSAPTAPMTAEALLCRQYLGWSRDDPRLQEGIEYLMANRIDRFDPNVYYWYYATQVLHHMADARWDEWNEDVRTVLPKMQETRGKERGSWPALEDRWGSQGGRLFVTCLSIYTLEVYYRHLPIYQASPTAH